MSQFNIPEQFAIPFFDHGDSLGETIKNSSNRRKVSPLFFVFRKIRNIILYRLAYFCPLNSWRIKMHRWRGVHIGKGCYVAQQCSIDNAYPELVFIEDHAGVNQGVTIIAHTNAGAEYKDIVPNIAAPVVVRHHVLCAINTILLPGADIGEYSIVTAGSLVRGKIPPYSLVQGNPARVKHNLERIIKRNLRDIKKSEQNKQG